MKDENEEDYVSSPEIDKTSFKESLETTQDFNKSLVSRKIRESTIIKVTSVKKIPQFGHTLQSYGSSPHPLHKSDIKAGSNNISSELT